MLPLHKTAPVGAKKRTLQKPRYNKKLAFMWPKIMLQPNVLSLTPSIDLHMPQRHPLQWAGCPYSVLFSSQWSTGSRPIAIQTGIQIASLSPVTLIDWSAFIGTSPDSRLIRLRQQCLSIRSLQFLLNGSPLARRKIFSIRRHPVALSKSVPHPNLYRLHHHVLAT